MRRQAVIALWLAILAGAGASIRAASAPIAGAVSDSRRPDLQRTTSRAPYMGDSVSRIIVARDLFRMGRRPAPNRHDPSGNPGTLEPTAQKPHLVLRGLMLGDTARALIEGFPGIEGARVLKAGESVAGLRVTSVSRLSVRVTGLDTAWVLTIRRSQ